MKYKIDKTVDTSFQQLAKHYMRFGLNTKHPISALERTWWPFIRWASSVAVYMDKQGAVYAVTSNVSPDYRLDKKARMRLKGK